MRTLYNLPGAGTWHKSCHLRVQQAGHTTYINSQLLGVGTLYDLLGAGYMVSLLNTLIHKQDASPWEMQALYHLPGAVNMAQKLPPACSAG